MRGLYAKATKHSHYQIMPKFLEALVDPNELNKRHSRFEKERLAYFQKHVPFDGKRIMDVGANTGYFTFESVEVGARELVAFEGNAEHAEFLRSASRLFHKPVTVKEEYLQFSGPLAGAPYDVVLLLNVLHHVGDDFGQKGIDIEKAKELIIKNLNYFADKTNYMIFQIGFSWMTNYDHPLFPNGSKAEMIEMVRNGIKGSWDEVAIGIAEVDPDGSTTYRDLSDVNIPRKDAIGEFRNRPIFILKSTRR